jgi:2-hydroxy-6-oxonona-2,4-dienedioate hydrolase
MRRTLIVLPLALILAAGVMWLVFQGDMRGINARLAASADLARTVHGQIAFASGGDGAPVLVIHGAGGGHDQGRLLAEAFLPGGYRWIAPSRFGYPGSPMPPDPSTAAQADAFAALLDTLRIDRVTLLAMSGGVPPALQFAVRHPQRTHGLILLSLAPYAPLTAEDQELPVPLWLYDALFASDFPLWAVLRLRPRSLATMFDARDDLTRQMDSTEAAFLDAMTAAFLPVTLRREGLANEGAAIDPAAPVNATNIAAPMLIVHARDDRLTPFSTARFTAGQAPGAKMLAFDTGGHLLVGHHATVRQEASEFLHRLGGPGPVAPQNTEGPPP